jgi:hypothetical protein
MGILDEAIREHLELKRRRGATDSELQKLEDEAFGPPSRPGEPDFPEHGDGAEQSGNGVAHEGAVAEAPTAPEAPIAPPPGGEPEGEEETAIYDETSEGDREPGDLDQELPEPQESSDEPPIETLDTVEHPLPEQEAEPQAPPEEAGTDESESQGPEEAPAPESEEEEETSAEGQSEDEEDVLADTPEFLKDAPEDDELWFEQGKPKDFDF